MSDPPTAPPQLPEDFDELVRAGARGRWIEALGYPIIPLLMFGVTALGLFVDGHPLLGFLFLIPALAPHLVLIHRMREHYGTDGERWKKRVTAATSEPRHWCQVDVICRFVAHPGPGAEMNVLVSEPGGTPRLAGVATAGTAVGLNDGPGWTWGAARKGEPLIVHVDGKNLWCIGPARGRWYTLNARVTAALVGSLNPFHYGNGPAVGRSGQGEGTQP